MTRRKRFGYLFLGLVLLIGIAGGGLYWASQQIPDFYEETMQIEADPIVRQESAKKFMQQTMQFAEDVKSSETWSQEFTQHQINSWLAEDFSKKFAKKIPKNIHTPRIRLTDETVQIGFKLDHAKYKGVISFRLRPFVTEDHKLAIEIESIRAGLVPVPLDEVLKKIKQHIPEEKWHVEWSHVNGHDVVLIDFAKHAKQPPQLDSIEVVEKAIRISGQKKNNNDSSNKIFPRIAEFPKEGKNIQ